jgi:hypothetical protein
MVRWQILNSKSCGFRFPDTLKNQGKTRQFQKARRFLFNRFTQRIGIIFLPCRRKESNPVFSSQEDQIRIFFRKRFQFQIAIYNQLTRKVFQSQQLTFPSGRWSESFQVITCFSFCSSKRIR